MINIQRVSPAILAALPTLMFLAASGPVTAQKPAKVAASYAKETPAQFEKRTKWWQDARFGMFIHWGVYAVPADATNKDGSKAIAEWFLSNKQMQMKEYEKFAPQFNPIKFDAKRWVQTAKNAGMKYIVITSKHHDGFDMFGTKLNNNWNIVDATPFKRDPIKELSVECKKQGIKLCFYHSIMDWHHADYTPRRPWEKDTRPAAGADYDRYVQYMKGQLKELVTNYGPLGVMWFDGEWEPTWTHARGEDLYEYVRSLQPSILVNNRVDKGRQGMQGMNSGKDFMGDFGTPEQEIPAQGFTDGRLWESCMTMNDTWGFARNDHNWKSPETLIRNLIDIASKGGNYLLNVGPTDMGDFPQAIDERLALMGEWMKANGESIYGTHHSPFKKLSFDGRCTQKGNKLYLQVFNWPADGLKLTGLQTPVHSARALATGQKLQADTTREGAIYVSKPSKIDPYATVVELTLAGPAKTADVPVKAAQADGSVLLKAADAEVHGESARYETGDGKDNIGFWTNKSDWVSWTFDAPKSGTYKVYATYACPTDNAGSKFTVGSGNSTVSAVVKGTGSWTAFEEVALQPISIGSGKQTVAVKLTEIPGYGAMNLKQLRLVPGK